MNPGSVDIVVSRAVLEHVPPPVIAAIFREARRVLRSGGRMLHLVDQSDHWSHRDRSINAVHFLKYPDWIFRLTCVNPQNYQNRLRHSEYRAMVASEGFLLKREEIDVDRACFDALAKMRVDGKFRGFSREDLATTSSILLAETPACQRKVEGS
jgi:SAM-dependent methyltransferase